MGCVKSGGLKLVPQSLLVVRRQKTETDLLSSTCCCMILYFAATIAKSNQRKFWVLAVDFCFSSVCYRQL